VGAFYNPFLLDFFLGGVSYIGNFYFTHWWYSIQ